MLFKPFTFPNGTTAKNRFFKSAMEEQLAYDSKPTDTLASLYDTWERAGRVYSSWATSWQTSRAKARLMTWWRTMRAVCSCSKSGQMLASKTTRSSSCKSTTLASSRPKRSMLCLSPKCRTACWYGRLYQSATSIAKF